MSSSDPAPPLPASGRPRLLALAAAGFAVAVVAAVLLISNRGSGGAADVSVSGSGVHDGAAPPQFAGTAVDGTRFDLSSTRGQVVLVNFFATWCSNCRDEEPLLERVSKQDAGRGLVVVGVNWKDTGDAVQFLHSYGVTYPALLDAHDRIGDAYGIPDLPESVFIGRDGRVVRVYHGQLTDDVITETVTPLLGARA